MFEYKIIRYKYIKQNDPIIPVDLVQDISRNLTEDEFKNINHCIYLAISFLEDIDNSTSLIQIDLAKNLKNKLKELL